jgi:hypothetical protein
MMEELSGMSAAAAAPMRVFASAASTLRES